MSLPVIVRKLTPLGAMFLIAGCGGGNPFEVTTSNCPAVAVVSYTGTVTKFSGGGRNAGDVIYNATMTDLRVDCQEDDKTGIHQRISFAIIASKGPAFSNQKIVLPYFAVLLRDNNLITAKKVFRAELQFDPNSDRVVLRQAIAQILPDIDTARRYDYELLVGFQLTPDEVAYNALR
jgi:hypothetical protein